VRPFAFLVHPRDRKDLASVEKHLPASRFARIKAEWSVFDYVRVEFGEAEGRVVVVPLTTAQMERLPRPFTRAKVLEAAQLAVDFGARVLGLGAMTSVVTRSGRWLSGQIPVLVSNGNAFTAAVVASQVKGVFGNALASRRLAIVGGGGSVGLACARLLAPACKRILLVGRYRPSLTRARTQLGPHTPVDVSTTLRSLESADVVVLATSSSRPILFAQHLRPEAAVFDLTEPSNLSRDCIEGARDGRFRIYRSGLVRAKGVDLTQIDPSLPRDAAYACLAEALLYALDARFVSHSVDDPTVELMNTLMETARRFDLLPSLESR
jgi:predicted amino acid dehydrogenase